MKKTIILMLILISGITNANANPYDTDADKIKSAIENQTMVDSLNQMIINGNIRAQEEERKRLAEEGDSLHF